MFNILFSNAAIIPPHLVRSAQSIEEAVRFGLDLHASSNVAHRIAIRDSDGNDIITFIKADAPCDSAKNE